jgi:hypothetical protein
MMRGLSFCRRGTEILHFWRSGRRALSMIVPSGQRTWEAGIGYVNFLAWVYPAYYKRSRSSGLNNRAAVTVIQSSSDGVTVTK